MLESGLIDVGDKVCWATYAMTTIAFLDYDTTIGIGTLPKTA